ncbi:MAG TPA: hypothetical protein VHX44_01720 [Planctomycetota bacterium]|nr:hypothetical protein [Planctomycetota bacterium]
MVPSPLLLHQDLWFLPTLVLSALLKRAFTRRLVKSLMNGANSYPILTPKRVR